MFSGREPYAAKFRVGNQQSMMLACMAAAFRTHAVMRSYSEANFEDHPSISSEYIKYLSTNSGREDLDNFETKLKGVKDNVDDLKRRVVTLEKSAGTVGKNVTAYKKEQDALARRINQLKKSTK